MAGQPGRAGVVPGTYKWPEDRKARYRQTIVRLKQNLEELREQQIAEIVGARPIHTGERRMLIRSLLTAPVVVTDYGKARGSVDDD